MKKRTQPWNHYPPWPPDSPVTRREVPATSGHSQETISIHFIPLLSAGCAFGAGLESRFRTCPKTIKNITCPLPSIASRCRSRLLRFRSWVCGRHVLQQPVSYYKVSEHQIVHDSTMTMQYSLMDCFLRNETSCCIIYCGAWLRASRGLLLSQWLQMTQAAGPRK